MDTVYIPGKFNLFCETYDDSYLSTQEKVYEDSHLSIVITVMEDLTQTHNNCAETHRGGVVMNAFCLPVSDHFLL